MSRKIKSTDMTYHIFSSILQSVTCHVRVKHVDQRKHEWAKGRKGEGERDNGTMDNGTRGHRDKRVGVTIY